VYYPVEIKELDHGQSCFHPCYDELSQFFADFFLDASYYLRAFADLVIIQEEASCAPRECEKVTALYGHGH